MINEEHTCTCVLLFIKMQKATNNYRRLHIDALIKIGWSTS